MTMTKSMKDHSLGKSSSKLFEETLLCSKSWRGFSWIFVSNCKMYLSQNTVLLLHWNTSHRVPGQGGSGGAQNSAPAVSLLNQFLFHYFTFHYDRSDDAWNLITWYLVKPGSMTHFHQSTFTLKIWSVSKSASLRKTLQT